MKESYTSKRRVRRSFGKIDAVADMPSLIEIQKGSYDSFIQAPGAENANLAWKKFSNLFSPLKIFPATANLSSLNTSSKSPNMMLTSALSAT